MNKEWSELNKTMQNRIKKKDTYDAGIDTLVDLRNNLWDTIESFKEELSREDFNAIPFIGADGYHSKTIAYSLWHIFRIEDIVAHTLIKEDEQVFFKGDYQKRIGSPIITTGNDLVVLLIVLRDIIIAPATTPVNYISDVKQSTESLLKDIPYDDLKKKITEERKEILKSLHVVSEDESAIWLIDYWCNKDVRGLIQMPFSRHWIMHIEACLRIKNKIR